MNKFTHMNREMFRWTQGVRITEDVLYWQHANHGCQDQASLAWQPKHVFKYNLLSGFASAMHPVLEVTENLEMTSSKPSHIVTH